MTINDCVKLYQMMAQRCASSGLAPNQAQIYSEMVDVISACDSVEESMVKIKNSPYYLAPSVALMQDKLGAWRRAAVENEMPEIVEVIDDKLTAIDQDTAEIYVTGYEQTIQNVKSKYLLTMQAYASVFDAYVGYIATGEEYNLNDMRKAFGELQKPSDDFAELAKLEKFRQVIPLNDEGYQIFVEDVIAFIKDGELTRHGVERDEVPTQSDFNAAWAEVQQCKSDIIAAGRNSENVHNKRQNLKEMVAHAPNINEENPGDTTGLKYTYSESSAASVEEKPKNFFSRFTGGE